MLGDFTAVVEWLYDSYIIVSPNKFNWMGKISNSVDVLTLKEFHSMKINEKLFHEK